LLGDLVQIPVKSQDVVDRRTAGRVPGDVLRAVETMTNHMDVQTTTATGCAPFADLYDRVDGAIEGVFDSGK
jgi:hypothetical protein